MKAHNFNSEEMDELLIQYLSSNVSDEEIKLIEDWILEKHSNKEHFDKIKELYLLGQITQTPSGFDKQKSLERIKRKYYQDKYIEIKEKSKGLTYRKLIYAIAATFLITLGIGAVLQTLFINSEKGRFQSAYNEVVAPMGSRTSLTLPDGTKVWLNAGSRIRYAMEFLTNDREITLSGEAFFEVSKIKGKRFVVHTGELDIKVWGTKFNVKAYPEEKFIQTTLVEGSVSIAKINNNKPEKQETFLVPNQTAIFYRDKQARVESRNEPKVNEIGIIEPLEVKKEVNTVLYTSWKDEKWVIEGQTLGSLAKELERRYDVEINFEGEALKNYKFNGIFANETLEQILEIVKISAPIDYEVVANRVTLKENVQSRTIYEKYLKRNN